MTSLDLESDGVDVVVDFNLSSVQFVNLGISGLNLTIQTVDLVLAFSDVVLSSVNVGLDACATCG